MSLIGCKKNSPCSEYTDKILTGMENLKKQEVGNITINTKMVPRDGKIESFTSEKDQLVNLSFTKKEGSIEYNYKVVERYNKESTETTLKKENNTFYTLSDGNWINVDSPQIDYYNSVFSMIDFKYREKDIKNFKVTQSGDDDIIEFTIDKKALSKDVNNLTYTYWIHEDQITKIIIEQDDTMTMDSETDSINTLMEISIN
jgi:hypothetical protein